MRVLSVLVLFLVLCGFSVNGSDSAVQVNIPAVIDGKTYNLEGMLYQPAGSGKHPAIVMTHGRNGPHPTRKPNERKGYQPLNTALADRGFIVLYVVRRGYGGSDGPDSEFLPTAAESGLEAAKDIRAAVEFLRKNYPVKDGKVIVMGHSQGGWAAMSAASLKMEGVVGAVNLCGGTNYATMGNGRITESVQKHWQNACAELGAKAVIPSLWIYSENDANHHPPYVKAMFDAYNASGGKGFLLIQPAYGKNGHMIVSNPSLYMDDVLDFFKTTGFIER